MRFRLCAFLHVLAAPLAVGAIISTSASAERYVYDATFESHPFEGNLWLKDLEGESELIPVWGSNPNVAPDGERIAYSDFDDIYVTDTSGGETRLVQEADPKWFGFSTATWTPDGTLVSDGGGAIAELRPQMSSPSSQWGREVILDWKGSQYDPDVSPDGSRIAFLTEYAPTGEWLPFGAIYVTDRDGSNPVRVTYGIAPGELTAWGLAFSPDGESLAVEGFDEDDTQSEIYAVDIGSGEFTAVTDEDLSGNPDWGSSGRIAFISEEVEELGQTVSTSADVVDPDGTDRETLVGPFGKGWFVSGISSPDPAEPAPLVGQEAAEALLPQYAPTLIYDDEEIYRAVRAESATAPYEGTELSESNRLRRVGGTLIASNNPAITNPPLSLAYLDGLEEEYGVPGTETPAPTALSSDVISLRNTYSEDAEVMQADPEYADAMYGRVAFDGERWWLQYWFFYYFNDWLPFGAGDHEGDWEMIQVGLDGDGRPALVTYAQHNDNTADQCFWEDVDVALGHYGNLSPVVYVANGSHASYLRPGSFIGDPPLDEADGDGYAASPYVAGIDPSAGWVEWPGRWGDSEERSPFGPAHQGDKWDAPASFHEQAQTDCPTSSMRLGRAASLEAPRIDARLTDQFAAVSYRFDGSPPDALRVRLTSADLEVTPTGKSVRLEAASGVTRVRLPDGPGPYSVIVTAVDRDGQRSEEVQRRLRVRAGGRDLPDAIGPDMPHPGTSIVAPPMIAALTWETASRRAALPRTRGELR